MHLSSLRSRSRLSLALALGLSMLTGCSGDNSPQDAGPGAVPDASNADSALPDVSIVDDAALPDVDSPDASLGGGIANGELDQTLRLEPAAGARGAVLVSFGLTFPPDTLADSALIRLLDASGSEVPVHTSELARWHFRPEADALRSVLVQFRYDVSEGAQDYHFEFGSPRATADLPEHDGETYAASQLPAPSGDGNVPTVWVMPSAEWLSRSLVAWYQQPADTDADYTRPEYGDYEQQLDVYVHGEPELSGACESRPAGGISLGQDEYDNTRYETWLLDRPAALLKQYVRNGSSDDGLLWLQKGYENASDYAAHVDDTGWNRKQLATGRYDGKYQATEGMVLYYLLSGDRSVLPKIAIVADFHIANTGSGSGADYSRWHAGMNHWTERHAAMYFLSILSAYEVLGGDAEYDRLLEEIDHITDAGEGLYAHQTRTKSDSNPPGVADGSWYHTTSQHEGYGGGVAWASPWMMSILVDAAWQDWLIFGRPAARQSILDAANYLQNDALLGHGRETIREVTASDITFVPGSPGELHSVTTDFAEYFAEGDAWIATARPGLTVSGSSSSENAAIRIQGTVTSRVLVGDGNIEADSPAEVTLSLRHGDSSWNCSDDLNPSNRVYRYGGSAGEWTQEQMGFIDGNGGMEQHSPEIAKVFWLARYLSEDVEAQEAYREWVEGFLNGVYDFIGASTCGCGGAVPRFSAGNSRAFVWQHRGGSAWLWAKNQAPGALIAPD
ncbi:MAG: hypothetical protein AB8H86_32785 [Polyangiales bacterium]